MHVIFLELMPCYTNSPLFFTMTIVLGPAHFSVSFHLQEHDLKYVYFLNWMLFFQRGAEVEIDRGGKSFLSGFYLEDKHQEADKVLRPVVSDTGQHLESKRWLMATSHEAESISGNRRENKSQCFCDKQKSPRSLSIVQVKFRALGGSRHTARVLVSCALSLHLCLIIIHPEDRHNSGCFEQGHKEANTCVALKDLPI